MVTLLAMGFMLLAIFLLLGRLLGWAMGVSLIRKELERSNALNSEIHELLTIVAAQNGDRYTGEKKP